MPGIDSILGKKLGMTQVYTEAGVRRAVTAIEAARVKLPKLRPPRRTATTPLRSDSGLPKS
jgi:ribosomal protein L3